MKRLLPAYLISVGLLVVSHTRVAKAAPQDVAWTSLVNASVSGTTLIKSSDFLTGGAASSQSLASGDGYVEFTVSEESTNRGAGLSNGNPSVTLEEIDFAVRLNGAGSAEVWENGVYRFETTYVSGDIFRVEAASGAVLYKKNGVRFWTTAGAVIAYPLLVDAFLDSPDATLTDAIISGSGGGGSNWPNEPVGMTLLTDWGFDQAAPTSGDVSIPGSPGWRIVENAAPGTVPRGWVERVTDSGAPFSPSNAYDFVYPVDMEEGTAPATVYTAVSANEMYVGFWWKPSVPFDLGPNGNKIAFMFNGGGATGGQQFLILYPDQRLRVLPEYPDDGQWRTPNVNPTVVTLGVWHRIEWHANPSTGLLKWWLDGVLQGSYMNVKTSAPFDEFKISPTWGGNSHARKRWTDHYWFDHVRVSVR